MKRIKKVLKVALLLLLNPSLTAMEIVEDELSENPVKVIFKFKNQTGRHHKLSEQPSRIASTTIQEHTPNATKELCTKKFYFPSQIINCKFIFTDKEFSILKITGNISAQIENANGNYRIILQLRIYPDIILLKEIKDIKAGEAIELLVIFNPERTQAQTIVLRTDELFRAIEDLDITTVEKLSKTMPLHIPEKNGETALQKAIQMFIKEEDKEFPNTDTLDKIIDMIRTLIILDKELVDVHTVTQAVKSPRLFNKLKTYFVPINPVAIPE